MLSHVSSCFAFIFIAFDGAISSKTDLMIGASGWQRLIGTASGGLLLGVLASANVLCVFFFFLKGLVDNIAFGAAIELQTSVKEVVDWALPLQVRQTPNQ